MSPVLFFYVYKLSPDLFHLLLDKWEVSYTSHKAATEPMISAKQKQAVTPEALQVYDVFL